jgi:protein-disulfide isomerase
VAYLNRFSSTQYSSRSSAAAGCAADAGVLPGFARLLFANQPPEGGDGLPDEQLVALGTQAGAGPGFATCVQDGRYAGWTRSVTDAASRAGITATPTVLVNGREVGRTAEALRAAVAAG